MMISDVVASTSLQYQLSTSLADPNLIMIYERYPGKNDLIDPHRKSVVFSWVRVPHHVLMYGCDSLTVHQFGGELKDIVEDKSVDEWTETNVGYMSR